jgi:hypothetical protein
MPHLGVYESRQCVTERDAEAPLCDDCHHLSTRRAHCFPREVAASWLSLLSHAPCISSSWTATRLVSPGAGTHWPSRVEYSAAQYVIKADPVSPCISLAVPETSPVKWVFAERVGVAENFYSRIQDVQEVLGSSAGQDVGYPEVYHGFPQYSHAIVGIIPPLCHDWVLPNPFTFIDHRIIRRYVVSILKNRR